MPRNLVLFDLEWNIGYQPYTFNYHGVQQTLRGEIVEIGAVKIDEDANVLDTFSIHLRPRIFRKLQHHIAKVTGLTQADLDRGEPIVQGLRRFMQWCGPDAEFAEWGLDDVPVLKQNLFLCNLDESRPTVWYDLQQVFLREHPRKEGEGMTLESVVTRMGVPMERPFHDALSDTLYTADVCRLLDLRAGLAAYPTEDEALRQSLCQTPGDYRDFTVFHGYVEQYAWRADPKISQMPCPECGTTLQPDEIWLKKGSNSWYTLCQCPSCTGSSNAAGQGVFQRYKLSRRDGLHWSFARCAQMPDAESLARWEKLRTAQLERMRAKAEKQAAKGAEDSKLTSAQKVAKAEKSKAKAAKPKNPNGNIFQRFVKGFKKFWKDFRGEIKKITWPGAKTVLKNTGVVLVSVAVVGVVIYAIDQGLSFLVSKLIELAQKTGENKETAAAILSMINLGL